MTVTPLPAKGNSSKFHVATKHSEFDVALSFTLRNRIWSLADDHAELDAAEQLAEAIVSRHNPKLPFKLLYVFAEHNTLPTLAATVQRIRTTGM